MKIFLFATLFFFCCIFFTNAQPAIDSTDMPVPNDTIKRTVINDLSVINYTNTGSNFIWDFSMVNGADNAIDTFISVLSTPFTYIAVFYNPFDLEHKASVASPQPPFQSLPGVQIANMYNFYKNTSEYYGQVGFGAEINSLPVPVKYDNADIIYRFPMVLGSIDTSLSQYSINIPNLGYNGQKKQRINYVDGWGTLYVPGDTFEVFRIKSILNIFDSLYIDSLGFGFGFDRTETEYKWLAKSNKMPVFQVNKRQGGMGGNNTDGWFVDNRPEYYSVKESSKSSQLFIYPNPCTSEITVINPGNDEAFWQVYELSGRLIMDGSFSGTNTRISVENIESGMYFIKLKSGDLFFNSYMIKIR